MICPRCKTKLTEDELFCHHCGLPLRNNQMQNRQYDRPRKKRWETYRLQNYSLNDIQWWFNTYGDSITVLGASGNIRFRNVGFRGIEWYAPYFNIRYYPESSPNQGYRFYYKETNSSLKERLLTGSISTLQSEYNFYSTRPNNCFHIYRDAYMSGGLQTACFAIIYSYPKTSQNYNR